MKTVRDIFVDALSLNQQGLTTRKIADFISRAGSENELSPINEVGHGETIDLKFSNGELIRFDGSDWHHVRT